MKHVFSKSAFQSLESEYNDSMDISLPNDEYLVSLSKMLNDKDLAVFYMPRSSSFNVYMKDEHGCIRNEDIAFDIYLRLAKNAGKSVSMFMMYDHVNVGHV